MFPGSGGIYGVTNGGSLPCFGAGVSGDFLLLGSGGGSEFVYLCGVSPIPSAKPSRVPITSHVAPVLLAFSPFSFAYSVTLIHSAPVYSDVGLMLFLTSSTLSWRYLDRLNIFLQPV